MIMSAQPFWYQVGSYGVGTDTEIGLHISTPLAHAVDLSLFNVEALT